MVTAICPYCGKQHKIRIDAEWTGNRIPRVYHKHCRQIIERREAAGTLLPEFNRRRSGDVDI
jgi:hypothetical protein